MLAGRRLVIPLAGVGALLALTGWALLTIDPCPDCGPSWPSKPEMALAEDGIDRGDHERTLRIVLLRSPHEIAYADLRILLDDATVPRAAGQPVDGEWAAYRAGRLLAADEAVREGDAIQISGAGPLAGRELSVVGIPCNCHLLPGPDHVAVLGKTG